MKKILVTGANGFVGKSLMPKLCELSDQYLVFESGPSRKQDLTRQEIAFEILQFFDPDIVIHLAAKVGGIGANQNKPGQFIYDNTLMGLNVIEAARHINVERFIMLGTVCSYPKYCPVPFIEQNMWDGYPEETNAPYGIAKRALMQTIMSYNKQFGFQGINLVPTNMYGPGDNFDPETSHVIPALILKIQNAIDKDLPFVQVWGTGKASREFLYVEDCCDAIIKAIECPYPGPEPINIGTGRETPIWHLVDWLCYIMDYSGDIHFDDRRPDGQPKRCLEISTAKRVLDFKSKIPLEIGLPKTVEWFNDRHNNL
jgi:GDP-L-fucose synthase